MDQKLYPPRQDRHIEEFAEYDFSVEMGRHERLELERELLRRKILYTLPSYVFLRSDGEEMGYSREGSTVRHRADVEDPIVQKRLRCELEPAATGGSGSPSNARMMRAGARPAVPVRGEAHFRLIPGAIRHGLLL